MFGCRTIRMICNSRFYQTGVSPCRQKKGVDRKERSAHLESLVLKNSLDRRIFAGRRQLCLKHYSKASVPNNLALCVLHFLRLAGNAILDLLSDDFCKDTSASNTGRSMVVYAHLPCASY